MTSIPVYIQIHDKIKSQIESGTWQVGDRLPSERELAITFDVSRMTLRQAIASLVDEGILERRVGSGTFVASARIQERMRGTTSFTEIVTSQGKVPSSEVISYIKTVANEVECEHLALQSGEPIVRMERVRYADQVPIAYEVTSIPFDLVLHFDKEAISHHFFKTLKENGYQIGASKQTISAKLANKDIANYLNIKPNQAILGLTQTSYFTDGRPFEYVLSQYVGDRFEFYLEQ